MFGVSEQRLASQRNSATSGRSWETSLGERTIRTGRTETGNQVSSFMFMFMSFMFKSRLFKLIRSRTSHH